MPSPKVFSFETAPHLFNALGLELASLVGFAFKGLWLGFSGDFGGLALDSLSNLVQSDSNHDVRHGDAHRNQASLFF
jgi:hypothetical protein